MTEENVRERGNQLAVAEERIRQEMLRICKLHHAQDISVHIRQKLCSGDSGRPEIDDIAVTIKVTI